MSDSFGDTSYFLALLIPDDVHHADAHRLSQHLRSVVTSEYVVVEVGNYLSRRVTRHVYGGFFRVLHSSDRVTVLPASSDLLRIGSELYVARTDKTWSPTDCISFEIMRMQGIKDALTADHHFEQAGFNVLLKPLMG